MQIGNGEVLIANENGVVHVTLRGDFDLANVPDLATSVAESLWPARDLVIDLEGVTFLDGRLLHWLIDLRRDVHHRSGRMLVRPGRVTLRVLTALRMTHEFELVRG